MSNMHSKEQIESLMHQLIKDKIPENVSAEDFDKLVAEVLDEIGDAVITRDVLRDYELNVNLEARSITLDYIG